MTRPEPEWWAKARGLYKQGLTETEIGERMERSRSAVARARNPKRWAKYRNKTRAERRLAAQAKLECAT